jgi:hypothetical protein
MSGSKMRMTIFSPNAVGMLDKRSSTSRPPCERVLMRPSCGRRFSATSMRPRILMREVTAVITGVGSSNTLCMTPSMRKRMLLMSRRGSRWMSDALLERVLQQPVDDVHDMAVVDADVAPPSTRAPKLRMPLPTCPSLASFARWIERCTLHHSAR